MKKLALVLSAAPETVRMTWNGRFFAANLTGKPQTVTSANAGFEGRALTLEPHGLATLDLERK